MLNYIILNKETKEVQYFEKGKLKIKQHLYSIQYKLFSHNTGHLLSLDAHIYFPLASAKEFKIELGEPLTVKSGFLYDKHTIGYLKFFVKDFYIEDFDHLYFLSPCRNLIFTPFDSHLDYNFKSVYSSMFSRMETMHKVEVDSSGKINFKVEESDIKYFEQKLQQNNKQWKFDLTSKLCNTPFKLNDLSSENLNLV